MKQASWTFPVIAAFMLTIVIACQTAAARQGVVRTLDGRTIQGDITVRLTDQGQFVDILIHGVSVSLPRSDVASIDYRDDLTQEFNQRLGKLSPTDVDGRIKLAVWAMDRGNFALANHAVTQAQRIAPDDPRIASTLATITATQALQSRQAAVSSASPKKLRITEEEISTTRPSTESTNSPSSAPSSEATEENSSPRFLTMADVYAIRRAELLADDDVRVEFLKDVVRRYRNSYPNQQDDFDSATRTQKAIAIINCGDAKLASQVRIESNPAVLETFAQKIQPLVLSGCAAARCHGEGGAGGFVLFTSARSAQVTFTNYYILQKVSRDMTGGDTFGHGAVQRPMIDRLHPQASLLVQFGLPYKMATTPHPKVPNFRPIFSSQSDPAYTIFANWIGSMKAIAPDYGITYTIPRGSGATTQPQAASSAGALVE